VHENLLSEKFTARGIVKPESVKKLVNEHLNAEREHTSEIWTLLMLELWFKKFID
jgi:asparagine synthase (glutamine-hydrolysing)